MKALENGLRNETRPKLKILDERAEPEAPQPEADPSVSLMLIALRALSQRFAVAFGATFFPLIVLGLGVYLWTMVMNNPSILQLVALGLYGVFALCLTWIRRK